jgi:energy-coupling factor transporter ATP-binding protein EcfA2
LIRYFGLEAHAQAPARALAPGRRRLAALACATVRKPDLLLIDTPFADLDRGEAQRVAHMLAQLQGLGAALILAATQTDPYELRHWPAMRLDRGRLHLNPARDGP